MGVRQIERADTRPGNNVTDRAECFGCTGARNFHGTTQCLPEILRIDNGKLPTVGELIDRGVNPTRLPKKCPNGFVPVENVRIVQEAAQIQVRDLPLAS